MQPVKRWIAITGGIGSGKSYVCQLLLKRGIVVYDCDEAAKRLMRESPSLRSQLKNLVGNDVYRGTDLQKRVLAAYILQSDEHKQAVNDIVHPAVASDFINSGYEWLESAILFESGFSLRVPFYRVVCVSAPLEVRIARIMRRDSLTRDMALQWINRQMPQSEMVSRSDFEIVNDGERDLESQIDTLLINLDQ